MAPTTATTTSASTPATSYNVAPNPVMVFLCQRELPKALHIKSVEEQRHQQHLAHKDNKLLRKMHQAGGYEFSSYEKRNWSEIFGQIS